jgi:hypothetical protein
MKRSLITDAELQHELEMSNKRSWGAVGLIVGLSIGISGMIYTEPKPQVIELQDIRCTVNPSLDLIKDGWLQMYDVDQGLVTRLVSEGKAEFRRENTLVCYDTRPSKPYRVIVAQEWWKRK